MFTFSLSSPETSRLPCNVVAPRIPAEESNVRLLPDLGGKFPVAAVANKGKQVVSEDSSATVTLVAVVALSTLTPVKLL